MKTACVLRYSRAALDSECRRLGLKLVILFGSRAGGVPPPSPESDLDIAVLGHPPFRPGRFDRSWRSLSGVFSNYQLDLVFLDQADPLFRHEILGRGRRLYGNPLDFLEYKAFAFRDYTDSRDLLRLEDALFRKKMAWIKRELHGTA